MQIAFETYANISNKQPLLEVTVLESLRQLKHVFTFLLIIFTIARLDSQEF